MSGFDSDRSIPRRFATTQWSMVIQAGKAAGTPQARQALSTLCELYWYPLYAYVRRRGHDVQQAQDLTQGFFGDLLARGSLQTADPGRGKFRTFLLSSFNNFVAKERRYQEAAKRGGGQPALSLDFAGGEKQFQLEPADELTAERAFERRWALTLLNQALVSLEEEFTNNAKESLFQALKPYLAGPQATSYQEQADKLEMTESAVKVAIHRLRRRYREILRRLIAETVDDPAEIDEELRHLFDVV